VLFPVLAERPLLEAYNSLFNTPLLDEIHVVGPKKNLHNKRGSVEKKVLELVFLAPLLFGFCLIF
jgi:hypothetical protein